MGRNKLSDAEFLDKYSQLVGTRDAPQLAALIWSQDSSEATIGDAIQTYKDFASGRLLVDAPERTRRFYANLASLLEGRLEHTRGRA